MNENIPVSLRETLMFTIRDTDQKKFIVKTRSVYNTLYLVEAHNRNEAIEAVLGIPSNNDESLVYHNGESSELVEQVSNDFTLDDLRKRFPEYHDDV